jgi:hypothetical protein
LQSSVRVSKGSDLFLERILGCASFGL